MNSYVFEVRAPRAPRATRVRRRSRPSTALVLAMFVLYLLFLMAGACSDAEATAPSEAPIQLPMATVQQVADFTPSLTDVQSRLLPTLSDAASVTRLNSELSQLASALLARDVKAVQQQIEAARATLAAYPAAARATDAVELSVIELVLDRAAQLVGMPALANRSL